MSAKIIAPFLFLQKKAKPKYKSGSSGGQMESGRKCDIFHKNARGPAGENS